MKKRDVEAARLHACSILGLVGIKVGQDFHTIPSSQVQKLLEYADSDGYQGLKGASDSRARHYHDRLQRHAQAKHSK